MPDPDILSFEKHGKLRLSARKDFSCFKAQHLVPVVFQEFYGLATEFPLVFVRNAESGEFVPVAMMGLKKGENLYCQSPEWMATFVPRNFTAEPFTVAKLEPSGDEAVINIDVQSSLLSESAGELMFATDGERTTYLQTRIDHVVAITRQMLQTSALCQLLVQKRLLKERPVKLQYAETAHRYEVEGMYIIDEEKLEQFNDQEYLELRQRGLLPLIYSHLTSLHQFGRLTRLQFEADQAAQGRFTG